jgi:hypothetical protein
LEPLRQALLDAVEKPRRESFADDLTHPIRSNDRGRALGLEPRDARNRSDANEEPPSLGGYFWTQEAAFLQKTAKMKSRLRGGDVLPGWVRRVSTDELPLGLGQLDALSRVAVIEDDAGARDFDGGGSWGWSAEERGGRDEKRSTTVPHVGIGVGSVGTSGRHETLRSRMDRTPRERSDRMKRP